MAAEYNAKHCAHVVKSGIAFLELSSSCSCTRRTRPSRSDGKDLGLLFAGDTSAKSMYSLAQILWSNFVGSAGRPALMGAIGTSVAGFVCLYLTLRVTPPLTSFKLLNVI